MTNNITQGTGDTPRRIAILGSSGGNLRSHGGDDPQRLLGDIVRQAQSAGIQVTEVQFVAAAASMDGISETTAAHLYGISEGTPILLKSGTLNEINTAAREQDTRIAEQIISGNIDGLVLVSHDPNDTNNKSVMAAAKAGIPAAGTGGTSVATAQQMGVKFVAASGTTGTTSSTRAVSYIGGLARHWGIRYRPSLGTSQSNSNDDEPAWKRISIRGIMVGSIPAFIALALLLAISKIPATASLVTPVFELLLAGLPIVVSAVAARKVSGLDEVGLVAGSIAGILAQKGGIIGGLASGVLAGLLAAFLIRRCLSWNFPATTANIVTGAIAGLVPGAVVYYLLAPFTSLLGDWIGDAIQWSVAFNPGVAGALAGLIMWPAIMAGVYHSVILPLVLLEMGEKGHSFFGAIDLTALVAVSLGITVANTIKPRESGERALAASGGAVNFFFGTFVEASYPFLFGDRKVFGNALIAAIAGGAVIGITRTEATAYLPIFIAPFVSTNIFGVIAGVATAFAIAFIGTLLLNRHYLANHQPKQI